MLNFDIESKIFSKDFKIVAGVDEAGRGPLAGPVVAACVCVPCGHTINSENLKLINDSKKMSPKQRESLFETIKKEKLEFGIGVCDNTTIDKINILQATFLAMKKAIGLINNKPDFIIVDGNFVIPNLSTKQQAIIKADEKIFSVAAASILAKVTRDRLMLDFHKKFPQYGFDQHKGYGTKLHFEKLKKHGPSPIHRLSFKPIKSLSAFKK